MSDTPLAGEPSGGRRPAPSERDAHEVKPAEIGHPIAYPPIERHGVVGDRRAAALVAADGTVNWLCLPNYDGEPVFAAILDAELGGYWRWGPLDGGLGSQHYVENTTTLSTIWETADGALELSDAMLWPQTDRGTSLSSRRAVVRRLRCRRGAVSASFDLRPRHDFGSTGDAAITDNGARIICGPRSLHLWASFPIRTRPGEVFGTLELAEDDEAWAILELGDPATDWSLDRARAALEETEAYWSAWTDRLSYLGPRRQRVRRSAITFHLLSFAPSGALVAAPTTSLPERIGGHRNYDYRFAWLRDVSLSMAILAMLGDVETAERYMDWLSGLGSETEMPLQVLYRIDGGRRAAQHECSEIAGYRGSKPVRFGNHAWKQNQIDSFGYFADCSLVYLKVGGTWKPEYWSMIRRLADYTAEAWREPGHGIWELDEPQHYVSGKVMAWVTLERAVRIAEKTGESADLDRWRRVMDEIRAEVLDKGWSPELQSFRQRYGSDALDASVLLIPMMGFLPADDPRMRSTIERIEQRLTVDGLVYRFDPEALPVPESHPLGEAEGAFLPCTFWLAAAFAMLGEDDRAEAILERVEAATGELGLFAEEMDPNTGAFLGNTPLLFSHAEYLKAVLAIAKSRPLGMLGLMASQAVVQLRNRIPGL